MWKFYWILFDKSILCAIKGQLHIQRSVQSSIRVKFGDDLRLDWDGRGRVLLKVEYVWWLKMLLVMICVWKDKQTTLLNFIHHPSWDHNGQDGPVVSVVTSTVTKVMTSCPVLVWWRRVLRHLASSGESMETVNLNTNMRSIHVPLTPKEVYHLTQACVTHKTPNLSPLMLLCLSSAFCRRGVWGDDVRRVHTVPLSGEPGSIPAFLSLWCLCMCERWGLPLLCSVSLCSCLRCKRSAAQLEVSFTLR